METIQIIGLITFSIAAICGTVLIWKAIDSKRAKQVEEIRVRNEQTERIAKDGAWTLYQFERERRIEAETREGIAKEQLRKERSKTRRLEQMIADCKVSDMGGKVVVL